MKYGALLRTDTDDLPPCWDKLSGWASGDGLCFENELDFEAPSRDGALLAGKFANEILKLTGSYWHVDWLFEYGDDGLDTASIPCEEFFDGNWDEEGAGR